MVPDATKQALQAVGDYDIVEKIAEGGMGTVYKARHRLTGEVVAIKLVAPHMATNPTYLQRFEKEYAAARAIDHPNVIRALEHGIADGRPYLVMEYVEGESLGQRLERVGRIPEAEAVRIISEAAAALQQAHAQGMVHRDVKPDNIMVTPDGRVKLADLGLVKEMDGDLNLTRTGRGLGTPHFMAPEQFRNAKSANVRCDIYSLGATLYMTVTGQMPFAHCPPLDAFMKKLNGDLAAPRKLLPTLSERTDWVIRRAMASDPEKRPATCNEFISDLSPAGSPVPEPDADKPKQEPWWYLKYADEEGMLHTVKGTVSGIRRALKDGRLGDAANVMACASKRGPFQPLGQVAPFREVVADVLRARRSNAQTPEDVASSPTEASLPAHRTPAHPDSEETPAGPHFRLEASNGNTLEWLVVFLSIIFAVGAGVIAVMVFQN